MHLGHKSHGPLHRAAQEFPEAVMLPRADQAASVPKVGERRCALGRGGGQDAGRSPERRVNFSTDDPARYSRSLFSLFSILYSLFSIFLRSLLSFLLFLSHSLPSNLLGPHHHHHHNFSFPLSSCENSAWSSSPVTVPLSLRV